VTSSPDETGAAPAAPRALVTGAAGFIGAHLARRLAAGGQAVAALARPSSDLWRLDGCPAGVTVVRGDLRDLGRGALDAALGDVDLIYHLAAAGVDQAHQDADALVETNVAGTLAVLRLAERVGATLRARGVRGRTVSIKVRFADFTTITRARTLREPTDVGRDVYATARELFDALGLQRARLRLVGVRVEGLAPAARHQRQLLLDERPFGWRDAERAVDRASARFGPGSVRPASLVRRDDRPAAPPGT
jgi:nucleoside-diphosphate-sugar epimerase